ncbi:cation-translocating P-type ATPase [Bradyrhizobium sp.]|uniref:cation-translocating P-type ATPase n=1 Tax=Bradyrhizobium sp. TaxID=376 RepID=UPI00239F841D|nr:cation-translocating P-type ATPase [Bradyrhizobium sp.]MDE2378907.1 cation-translocating P-type ATPase [Bradyrhizobium sp.]
MQVTRDFSHYVRDAGPGLQHIDLAVEGVHCAGCMAKIERGLSAIPDVTLARVNLTERRVALEWKEGTLDPARFIDRLAELGYKAYPFETASAEASEVEQSRFLLRCLGVAAFASMNVMMLSIPVWSGNVTDMLPEQRDFFHWLSALITLPAAAYAGQPFFRSAWSALSNKGVNMDVPISIGVILALGMSVVETINHAEHAYFDAAIMLLTFLLVGRYLDQSMRRRTRAVAGNLAALKAETAAKFVGPDEISQVPVAAIHPGDIVLLRPGERCAVDGTVIEGRSEIDQSLITGETLYVTAEQGTPVYAGSMNVSGTLRVRVAAASEATLLAEITRLLDNALAARSRYMRLADRASRLYAPVVHATALLTILGWVLAGASWHDAIVTGVAVLIITCPCALGLAIPTVQTVASGAMFKSGVLLNAGDAIERLAEADHVIFDKTGTLTLPDLEVVNAADIPADVFKLAGQLALSSHHPVAAAVAQAAGARSPIVGAVEEAGQGVRATVDGVEIRLGRPSFCGAEQQARESADLDPEASIVAFSRGTEKFIFAVRQGLRPDAKAVIAALGARKIGLEILSGDREPAVKAAAAALGIAEWRAGVTPADKIARIEELKQRGARVLMVGDGMNDAPSLAAAHVSMSPISAAHLSQSTADMVFLGKPLAPVVAAIDYARKALHLMRQNLWLAIVYNVLAVPIAISGVVTPLIAAAAMSGSSIFVMLNALRARSVARGID